VRRASARVSNLQTPSEIGTTQGTKMTRTATSIKVYWDSQDRTNEGWAYELADDNGSIDSGSIDCDADDLYSAIEWAISYSGLDLTTDQFAVCNDDGGYALWDAN